VSNPDEHLAYSYDVGRDEITIEGVRFAGEFFRGWGHSWHPGAVIRIISRERYRGDMQVKYEQVKEGE